MNLIILVHSLKINLINSWICDITESGHRFPTRNFPERIPSTDSPSQVRVTSPHNRDSVTMTFVVSGHDARTGDTESLRTRSASLSNRDSDWPTVNSASLSPGQRLSSGQTVRFRVAAARPSCDGPRATRPLVTAAIGPGPGADSE